MLWWKQLLSVAQSWQETEGCLGKKNNCFRWHYLCRKLSYVSVKNNHFSWHNPCRKHSDVSVKKQPLFMTLKWHNPMAEIQSDLFWATGPWWLYWLLVEIHQDLSESAQQVTMFWWITCACLAVINHNSMMQQSEFIQVVKVEANSTVSIQQET